MNEIKNVCQKRVPFACDSRDFLGVTSDFCTFVLHYLYVCNKYYLHNYLSTRKNCVPISEGFNVFRYAIGPFSVAIKEVCNA